MELRIKCDAKVDLTGFVSLLNVSVETKEYELNEDTLTGYVGVKGNYIKDDIQNAYEFNQNVPFTVVFNNKDLVLKKIEIEDFSTNEIINHGIECNFDMLITYSEGSEPSQEKSEEVIETIEIIEEDKENDFIDNKDDEEIKNDILEKYDQLLNQILDSRDDNFLEEEIEEVFEEELNEPIIKELDEEKKIVIVNSTDNKLRPVFTRFSDNYTSYHVYYPQKESELENICNKEKVSIERIYQDKANKDFKDKKRIIIK